MIDLPSLPTGPSVLAGRRLIKNMCMSLSSISIIFFKGVQMGDPKVRRQTFIPDIFKGGQAQLLISHIKLIKNHWVLLNYLTYNTMPNLGKKILLVAITVMGLVLSQVIEYFDHIIVGAGLAGLGASVTLTNSNAKHLIIEARDRVGGRVKAFSFAGVTQDEGASFVQYPYDSNPINGFVQSFKIGTIPANFYKEAVYYSGNGSLSSDQDLQTAEGVYSSLMEYINHQIYYVMDYDQPVSTLLDSFWKKNPDVAGFIKDRTNDQMLEEAIDNGADLSTMSSWEWDGAHDGWDYWDYAPQGGWAQLFQTIFTRKCNPVLHLSEVVRKIDYSGTNIVVTTNKNSYSTNKLMIGVPLGVLKEGAIEFVPPLPTEKTTAIDSIGFGIFQKLFVTFQTPFWPPGKSDLAFVGKGQDSKYSEAWVVPGNENMVIFFVGGAWAKELATWSNDQIKTDVETELAKYVGRPVPVKDIHYTKWQNDHFTLGGYSYAKVGTKTKHFKDLRSVLQLGNNKLWFIGEHTHPNLYSYTHGAYKSGVWAGSQALNS